MRLFFAVTLPDDVIERVTAAQAQLKAMARDEGVRWTRPDQFHYTLKFLGEQTPPRAQRAAETAILLAEQVAPFDLTVGGAGAFPNNERPSTLWIGSTAGSEQLVDLAGRLDKALQKQGFARETRATKAHLTLARVKTYTAEAAAARALRAVAVPEIATVPIDRFVLMQSTLKPSGSEYEVVEEYRLTGA